MKNRVNLYTEIAFNELMELGLINTCKCKNNECYELKKGFNELLEFSKKIKYRVIIGPENDDLSGEKIFLPL